MTYDPIRAVILVFGGRRNGNALGDFWQLDGELWTKLEPPIAPAPRWGAAMAWDAARKRVVLVGGTPSSDTWEWSGTEWSFVNADAAEGLIEHALVSSPTGAGVIAIGGTVDDTPTDDTQHVVYSSGGPYAACRSSLDDDEDSLAGCEDPDCWASCTPLCPPGTSCDPAAPRCGDGVCEPTREDCGLCASDCPCP